MSEQRKKLKTIEEVAQLTIASGQSSGYVKFQPPAGFITRIVSHYEDVPNPGFVQNYFKDAAGLDIAKLQPISAMRSREVEYENDGKPVNIDSGNRTFEYGVVATDNFTADFHITLLLVYEQEFSC